MPKSILTCLAVATFLVGITRGTPVSPSVTIEDAASRLTKAQEMLKYMNTSADPCEDFYEFSCGNYAKFHTADNDKPSLGPLELLSDAMDSKVILELRTDNATDTDFDKVVKNFYRSCIAAPKLDSVYANKLKELIKQFGQMPALVDDDSWRNADFDWLETVAKMARNTNEQIILAAHIVPDFVDNSKKAAVLASSTFSLRKKSFYVNEKFVKVHDLFIRAIAKNMHKFLGMEMDAANQTAKEIFEFEVALAHGLADDKDSTQLLDKYIPMDIDELQEQYLHFWDTKKLFTTVFGSVPSRVYVEQKYMENAKEVLKNTSNRVIANYVFYTYAMLFNYVDMDTPREMEEHCLSTTRQHFYKNVDNLMYRRLFTEQMKEGVYSIWQDIKATFEEVVQSPRLTWIHPDTRKHVIDKLQHMEMHINSYENVNFTEECQNMHVESNDYVENMKSILKSFGDKARAEADKPPQPFDLGFESAFTPLNLLIENKVFVPVSFLMPYHFWSISYPKAYNFANLGFYLAHEILHGFDNDGRLFDEEGNSHNWWDEKSVDEFKMRKKCFVTQYSKFIYNDIPLGEMDAQGENIADNGGVRLAYAAYLRWYNKAVAAKDSVDRMESLPGMQYTNRQLFFISYGQAWCNDVSEFLKIIQSMVDTHMPDRYRVIGPLSNFEEFHKEFKCPKGSGMNPADKCEIY